MIYVEVVGRAVIFLVFAASVSTKIRSKDRRHLLESARAMLGALRPGLSDFTMDHLGRAALVAQWLVLVLVVTPWWVVGVVLAALLLISFTAGLIAEILAPEDAQCACFGADGPDVSVWDVVRNGVLIAIAAALVVLAGVETRPPEVGAVVVLLCGAVVPAFLLVEMTSIRELFVAGNHRGK
ncbi:MULTISPECIES: MauE/DoxX family redox-associated membrane protein [unclassified Curtobacterium]|uniref:MauE/DoxX family redox-associated membrane protein n=1 Tax=unclassified Curtobacterium TaxID=257496 RepID=UPI0010446508|nr:MULTISPECIES: MauE/DoxX family redox-associated membrane protein [unclassified Curtobacterium]